MTRIMGVLNVTPDSFSDGGAYVDPEVAVAQAERLVAQGAHLIDVGGESTRPGSARISAGAEQERVLPVIRALADRGIAVSVDTIHAATAAAAVDAGARIINDVSGGLHDPEMLAVAAQAGRTHGVLYIAGHWRGIPDPQHTRSNYGDVVREVQDDLADRARAALAAGVAREQVILDPGLGFDKTGAQCWQLLRRLPELQSLGFPVLVGASRKRMLAELLAELPPAARDLPGAHERDLATAVVSALSARAGAWGVRVHEVASTVQALAVERAWGETGETVASTAVPAESTTEAADRIVLTGLEVFAHHGVFGFEREQGQRFLIDAELGVRIGDAARTDDLSRTVHYGELAEALVAAAERDPVDLIETLAERLAATALGFAGVQHARITVHKPDAPIRVPFGDVAVTILRNRPGGVG